MDVLLKIDISVRFIIIYQNRKGHLGISEIVFTETLYKHVNEIRRRMDGYAYYVTVDVGKICELYLEINYFIKMLLDELALVGFKVELEILLAMPCSPSLVIVFAWLEKTI